MRVEKACFTCSYNLICSNVACRIDAYLGYCEDCGALYLCLAGTDDSYMPVITNLNQCWLLRDRNAIRRRISGCLGCDRKRHREEAGVSSYGKRLYYMRL